MSPAACVMGVTSCKTLGLVEGPPSRFYVSVHSEGV